VKPLTIAALPLVLAACGHPEQVNSPPCQPPTVRCYELQLGNGEKRMACTDGNTLKLANDPGFARRT